MTNGTVSHGKGSMKALEPIDKLDMRRREVEEEVRLAALRKTGLLDSPSETEFDELVGLASEICQTPLSAFTLIDKDRQWLKSVVGSELRELPRDIAFCAHTIQQRGLLVVEDTTQDERFVTNPLVTGSPSIRFYAGMPLEAPGGAAIGTLCVMDVKPRVLTAAQCDSMRVLANQMRSRMEMRSQQRALRSALRAKEHVAAELAASERRFRMFMNHAPFVVYMKDSEERLTFYNAAMAERFAISSQEWLGKSNIDLWPAEVAAELRRNDQWVMSGGRTIETLEEVVEPNGTRSCWKSYKFPWWNERGEIMLGGYSIDVTEELAQRKALEEANEKLSRQATIDVLTGLPNRRVLDERVEFEYRFALRHKTHLSVAMLDLDNFKKINDEHGHAEGDRVLRELGRVLQETMRSTDLAARYGGEEFVVLLPGADTDGAILFAERVAARLRQYREVHGPVTASVGIASMDATTNSGTRLIQRADASMYEAKRNGKDRIETHRDVLTRAMAELEAGHS